MAEREGAERGGGTKPISSSGSRTSRGNRFDSSRSGGGGGRGGGSRGSTYPVYRGGRGTRGGGGVGGDYNNRRNRGPPPRFQNRNYRDDDYYYYEEYHPRMHRERKDEWISCEGDWSSTSLTGGGGGGGGSATNVGSGSSLSNSREESGDGVVIVDDQPQVSELIGDLLDSNDGFKEVTKRKTGKEKNKGVGGTSLDEQQPCGGVIPAVVSEPLSNVGVSTNVGSTSNSAAAAAAAAKKQAKEKKSRPSKSGGFERSRQSKLPPRLAKQRENNRINAMKSAAAAATGSCSPVESPTNTLFPVKDSATVVVAAAAAAAAAIPPPPKNAWDKPLTATLRANSPSQAAAMSLDGTTPSTAKSVSFDNHDSGVEISDQPNSGGSSQRSSPSDDPATNFAKVDKSTLDGTSVPSQTIIFENTNFKAAGTVNATVGAEYKAKFGDAPKPQRQRENRDRKSVSPDSTLSSMKEEKEKKPEKPEPIELPLSFSTKVEENSGDMKLDFTFDSGLAEVPGSVTTKGISLPRSLVMTTGSMQSPISPSTDDLNLKIASVKKVWETMAPVPEHAEDVTSSVAFSSASLSSVDSVAGLDHSPALEASFSPKDSAAVVGSCEDPTTQDVGGGGGYQGGSSLQQGATAAAIASAMVYTSAAAYTSSAAASLTKAEVSRSGNVCKVKPQQQAASSSVSPGPAGSALGITGGSLSPPLASGSAGPSNSMYQTLGSGTAAFGGIGGAIPSPPMMFNSNQQLPQTAGLYQPFLDGTPVLGQRGASQFSQYPPYGIGQGLSSSAFGQQSMFLQTPPPLTTPDLYTNNLSQYRLQPAGVTGFGQTQPQNQNTVLISSASNSLMSSAVKPSSQTFGNSQQNFGTIGSKAGTPFQQSGLGTALQGGPQHSQLYIYDPSQSMSLLGSQLVQRPGVQNSVLQAIQPPSSFYSNNGAAGAPGAPPPTAPPTGPGGPQQAAAGFYTASGSPLQAAVQQQAQPPLQTPPAAYSLQGFGNQSQGPAGVGIQGFGSSMSLAAQQLGAQPFRGAPTLPASFLKSLQQGANIQDTTRQQLKSPGAAQNSFSSTFFPPSSGISSVNSSSNSSCNNNSVVSNHGGGGTCGIPQQISSPKTQNRKMPPPTQSGLSHQSSNRNASSYTPQNASQMMSGSLRTSGMVMGLRGQLPMGSQSGSLGGPTAGMGGATTSSRYPNPGPIQRPPASQGPGASTSHRGGRGQSQGQQQQPQQQTQQRSSNPPSSAQQAKLRADALSTTQAFFNRDVSKSEKKGEDKTSDSISPKDELLADKVSSATPSSVADVTPK